MAEFRVLSPEALPHTFRIEKLVSPPDLKDRGKVVRVLLETAVTDHLLANLEIIGTILDIIINPMCTLAEHFSEVPKIMKEFECALPRSPLPQPGPREWHRYL